MADFRKVEKCLLGDFYPLTPYSAGDDVWMAWQFDSPERGEGMVQAFRRTNSPCEVVRFKLNGLNPKARYRVTDLDAAAPTVIAGRELAEDGLQVSLPHRRSSAILTYQRLK